MNPPAPVAAASPLLEVRNVSKSFPGVRALRGVSLSLQAGEVLAVIGENGAGKSTLMKILAGVQSADSGEILVDGRTVTLDNVRAAQSLGIALIHQELCLADNLDVGSNLFLGREPHRGIFLNPARQRREATAALARVGLDCRPETPIASLSLGRQQLVEIARALSSGARVIIMDEPTSSLSQGETDRLYTVVRELKSRGVGIIYISHRLGEVTALADRVTVLRDGRNAGELQRHEINHEAMVRLMVGRDLVRHHRQASGHGEPVLQVRGLRTETHPTRQVDFEVLPGEIIGIAGLVGAGRTEVLRAIFGIDRPLAGDVRVGGVTVKPGSPTDAIACGLGLVPEDRKHQGVFLEMAVGANTTLASLGRRSRWGLIRRKTERALATELVRRLDVRPPALDQTAQFLSGGNQQKVVLAKWLALDPRVLLLDEPTRGVDIGAKQEIYRLMEDLAGRGVAILFVSSELEEVLRMSDRALVMHEGRIGGELAREALSEEAVMHLATGGS
jgi:ribose transport system ATP-binding protein